MSCASCVGLIERKLTKVPGVAEVLVSLLGGSAEVLYETGVITPEAIAKKITVKDL